MTSIDGYHWTAAQGLVKGVPSIGVIDPPTNLNTSSEPNFDVVVVGAGYAGLTAVRDLTLSGLNVLLLEGRDRIGGRSWSSDINGYPFEMGGAWVSWGQPHFWREMTRYQMRDQLESSYDFSHGLNHFTLNASHGSRNMSHEEEDVLLESALKKFVNIDGEFGRKIMPFPHDEFHVAKVKEYDALSMSDRMKQIEGTLTPDEYTVICGFVLLCSCGTLENTSFYEFLHWWALCNHSYEYCAEYLIKYKLKEGQSKFALNFFEEALDTGHMSYIFDARVSKISDTGNAVTVQTADGRIFKASRVISTVPLNVMNDVIFEPPLSKGKQEAVDTGHINMCSKVHAECRNRELRSWSGIDYPNNSLCYAIGDGTTRSGNTHIVALGAAYNQLHPEENIEQTIQALQDLVSMDLERVVFHNWARDEFAKGAWFFSSPGFITRHLEDMRASHGNIHFANADWALGWRSFIDGAIEEGTRAALTVIKELRSFR